MKCTALILFTAINILITNGLENLVNSPTHECVRCLCHAVSGCYMLANCARYSINMQYWLDANSPMLNPLEKVDVNAYKKCMANDNCIIHTINEYTSRLGSMDCNCDGVFNCEDRLAIHYDRCKNMVEMTRLDDRKRRYQSCSTQALSMPTNECIPEVV